MRLSILIFLLLPFAEIATFVIVGKMIGVLAVLGLTFAAIIVGGFILRWKGVDTLRRLASETREGRDAGRDLVDAAFFVAAGVLLILPGFLTDIVALFLLIPGVRHFAWHRLRSRVIVTGQGFSARGFSGNKGFSENAGRQHQPPQREQPSETGVIDLDPEDFRRDDRLR